jgi:hypothetical protein
MGNEPTFEEYAKSLPALTKDSVLLAEKEWFEENVNKFKWLDKAKKELLLESDYQSIGAKKFIKKSGAKKLAAAFKISTQILETREVEKEWSSNAGYVEGKTGRVQATGTGKEVIVIVRARAVRRLTVNDPKNNRSVEIELESCEALAACSNYELAQKKAQGYNYHNVVTTAETRATNRAILNLLGGEVSAEEVFADEESEKK